MKCLLLSIALLISVDQSCGQYRNRPRGLGLMQLPTGMTDERSGPFMPHLYIAGDKAGTRPTTVHGVHLPGQVVEFTSGSAFNPFTQAVSAMYHEDLSDSWGAGFGVSGVNNYNLNVRKNFDQYADVPLGNSDGTHQPFVSAFTVGGEYDPSKFHEVAGALNLPILGVNELFDLEGRWMAKGYGNSIETGCIDFPLTLSYPHERFSGNYKYLNFMADRLVHYGHVVPNVNLFLVEKDKIMKRLIRNRANPTIVG